MGEFDLIREYFSRETDDPDVILGVGDDGALLLPESGRQVVVSTDTLVEGVHFPPDFEPADLGYRAVAVNLSDLASMGSRPRWMTLALTLRQFDAGWLERFSAGLFEAAKQHDVSLIGGDTTRGRELVVTIGAFGDTPAGQVLRRSGADIGDYIYVSGHPGDAAAGLRLLLDPAGDSAGYPGLTERFRRPEARVALGQALVGVASACIDMSDGLHADLGKLVSASGLGADIDVGRLPFSDELKSAYPDDLVPLSLGGGDDYELCFTVSPDNEKKARQVARSSGVVITRIGSVVEKTGVACFADGKPLALTIAGYDHFGSAG